MELLDRAGEAWTEQLIENRTSELIGYITEIWPAPQGHISSFVGSPRQDRRRTTIADLIGAGLLESGATLYPRKKRIVDVTATVLSDGGIDVAGVRYTTPSGAASSISGGSENGWWFFLLTPTGRRSLSDLWHEYRNLNSTNRVWPWQPQRIRSGLRSASKPA
jgi:Restriction Enzyme Adenine Methylase Associated